MTVFVSHRHDSDTPRSAIAVVVSWAHLGSNQVCGFPAFTHYDPLLRHYQGKNGRLNDRPEWLNPLLPTPTRHESDTAGEA